MPGPARRACAVLLMVAALTACGEAPPTAASLLSGTSSRMSGLKGFHFKMQVGGYTGTTVPVQTAEGDAHPPDLHARVDLREGGFLVEVEVIFNGDAIYLKSITGGWQRLTPAQVAQFFDARSLFDRQVGLFAAIRDTQAPTVAAVEKVDGHDTYPVKGTVSAARVHQILTLVHDQGSYSVTYWIESPRNDLWRAQVSGNLFDATRSASITFDFSNHDHPVSVTPPPVG